MAAASHQSCPSHSDGTCDRSDQETGRSLATSPAEGRAERPIPGGATGKRDVIEVTDGPVHKALSVHSIRYDTHAKLNLRFDHRYDRSIQLNADQLAQHIRQCADILSTLKRGA